MSWRTSRAVQRWLTAGMAIMCSARPVRNKLARPNIAKSLDRAVSIFSPNGSIGGAGVFYVIDSEVVGGGAGCEPHGGGGRSRVDPPHCLRGETWDNVPSGGRSHSMIGSKR